MSNEHHTVDENGISLKNRDTRWRSRRRAMFFSLICVVSIIAFHYWVALNGTIQQVANLNDYEPITMTAIFGFFSVIGAYIGFKAKSVD